MENFIVQINGSYIDLPYVANAADGKSQPRRSYLTSGTEVASGCGYSYCYKTLKLVLKGKEHFLPENLYREGVSYRFLDTIRNGRSCCAKEAEKSSKSRFLCWLCTGLRRKKSLTEALFAS